MNISISTASGMALFRTPFLKGFDLVQKFKGINIDPLYCNTPVEFAESGLIQNEKWDFWHTDLPLSISTDEVTPMFINDEIIGGNHGDPSAVLICVEPHDKTVADLGSVWKDDAGVLFTLMRIGSSEHLLFMSENVGKSETDYKFVREISGSLTYVSNGQNTSSITNIKTQRNSQFTPAIRHTDKSIYAFKDGQKTLVYTGGEYVECDYAQINEEYDIINPATVAPALTAARPKGGYTSTPCLSDFGKAMGHYHMIFHIQPDGTVLCDFECKKLQDVKWTLWMGAMFQEKIDAYRGGIFRSIPGSLPFTTGDGTFDFSKPLCLSDPFPKQLFPLSNKYWEDPSLPPDHVVDIFRDQEGHDKLGFACGFLPLYEGQPQIRSKNVSESAINIVRTRKVYPIFKSGDIQSVRGIAYKKYFLPQKDKASAYTVNAEGKSYIYMDFFAQNNISVPVNGNVELFYKKGNIKYEVKNGVLNADADSGHAVFICEQEGKK